MFRVFSEKIILSVIFLVLIGAYHIQADALEPAFELCENTESDCPEDTPEICRNIKKDKLYNDVPDFLPEDFCFHLIKSEDCRKFKTYKPDLPVTSSISYNELARSHI